MSIVKVVLCNLAKASENLEKLEAVSSKERLETWKFAAEEIVDMLKTVRQEGEGGSVNSSIRTIIVFRYKNIFSHYSAQILTWKTLLFATYVHLCLR